MIDADDQEAIHTIVGAVAVLGGLLYAMHLLGFRSVVPLN
jgi:hypothetical protein